NVHVLTDLGEHAGHAGILTDGQTRAGRSFEVLAQCDERLFGQRPRFRFARGAQRALHITGQFPVGLHAQTRDGIPDLSGTDRSHARATPVSRAALATAAATASATRGSNAPGMM